MGGERNPDGVDTYQPDAHDRALIRQAQQDLSTFSVPLLVRSSHPDERLYIAAFDGTGNDRSNPDRGPKTNVALIYEQVELLKTDGHKQIAGGYVEGPGTQDDWLASKRDAIRGHTYDARLEEMYFQFVSQAKDWLDENPSAQIRIANMGFSRGAEQAAGFARMVHERGIQNPEGMSVIRGDDGLIDRLEFTRPPLVPPGQTAQALALFDPVGTGEPYQRDRRPSPSVITGFQIKAEDEARDQFLSSHILDRGFTHGDRFLRVLSPGAHSDVGGSYVQDGLSRINGNLMVDYLNGLSDRPFLDKRPLRPDLEVIHRSEQHQVFYSTDIIEKREKNGFDQTQQRGFVENISGDWNDTSAAARDAEPRDDALDESFQRRAVPIGPVPPTPARRKGDAPEDQRTQPQPKSYLDRIIDRLSQGALDRDDAAMDAAVRDYERSPMGRAFRQEADLYAQTLALQERQNETGTREHERMMQPPMQYAPPVMRM